jgi:hypothetical protein
MISPNQQRARRQYRTDQIAGDGPWARVSRCLPVIMVRLFMSRADADAAAASGKKCSEWGCRGLHTTEELDVEDIAPWAD